MKNTSTHACFAITLLLLLSVLAISGCNSSKTKKVSCPMPQGHNLDAAFGQVRDALSTQREQCAPYFDTYMQRLLAVAEGDPGLENKRHFSEFLVWASAEDIISKRQAKKLYNRYFNVKFVTLKGDYNSCSMACPKRAVVMSDMSQELVDKEQGLLKVSADTQNFYRADRLFKETELVLEATCNACNAKR